MDEVYTVNLPESTMKQIEETHEPTLSPSDFECTCDLCTGGMYD